MVDRTGKPVRGVLRARRVCGLCDCVCAIRWTAAPGHPFPAPLVARTTSVLRFRAGHTHALAGPPMLDPPFFFSMWVSRRTLSRKCLASFRFKTEAAAETCRTKQRRAPSGDCSWTTEKNSKSQRSKVLHRSYAKRRTGSALANSSWMA